MLCSCCRNRKDLCKCTEAEKIASWLEGLSRHPACVPERRYWYEGVAADIRNGAWKLA